MPSRMVASRPQDGALFTWGDGASGALGYEHPSRQYIPRQVGGALHLEAVTQVRRPGSHFFSTPFTAFPHHFFQIRVFLEFSDDASR